MCCVTKMSVKSAGSVTSATSVASDSAASVTSSGHPKKYRKRALFQITKVREAASPWASPCCYARRDAPVTRPSVGVTTKCNVTC